MLAISQIKDLFAGKLTDQAARECLIELSAEKPSASFINDLISTINEINSQAKPALPSLGNNGDFIDCCSTGGSGLPHYNSSTTVAFILASGGVKVTKFGNRSSKNNSGSFNFLEALGIPDSLPVSQLTAIFDKTNIAFLFAPQFYPVFSKLAPIRKSISGPTIFNLIGPLLNPVDPPLRILGTATKLWQQAIAEYLHTYKKQNKRSLIVNADSGLDELDPKSNNTILSATNAAVTKTILSARGTNFTDDHRPTNAQESAQFFKDLINNTIPETSYLRSLLTLNAGAGFQLAGKVKDILEGQRLAGELLTSGKVSEKYKQCRSIYEQYAK